MRVEKELLLQDIKNKIEGYQSFIVTKYFKLSATDATDFRNKVHEVGGEYEVVSKRVFLKAANQCGIDLKKDNLEGHIGVVFASEEAVETAKIICAFSKEKNNVVSILAGHIDGQLCDATKVEFLSKLPSKDEMRAQVIGLFEAPMAQTLSTFEAILTGVLYCMDNKVTKASEG